MLEQQGRSMKTPKTHTKAGHLTLMAGPCCCTASFMTGPANTTVAELERKKQINRILLVTLFILTWRKLAAKDHLQFSLL